MGRSAKELSVSGSYRIDDPTIQAFDHVRLPNLKSLWTKDFEVRVEEFLFNGFSYDIAMNGDYVEFVVRILRKMPNLGSSRYEGLL